MKNSMLRIGSLTILMAITFIFLTQGMDFSVAHGNQGPGPAMGVGGPWGGLGWLPRAMGGEAVRGPAGLPGDFSRRLGARAGRHGMAKGPLSNGVANGIFFEAPSYDSGGNGANSVAVADVNGDGRPDLLVTNACADSTCTTGSVGVLLGNGDGTFQSAVDYASGGFDTYSIAAADVNGDGRLDLVVTNLYADNTYATTGGVGVLLGNGDGTFQPVVTYSSGGYYPDSIAVADVNGDGRPDLLVANECNDIDCMTTGSAGVLLANSDGTFQPAVTYSAGGFAEVAIAVADVNGDGRPDLLVVNECGDSNCGTDGSVGVLLGIGDGTFQAAEANHVGGTYLSSIVVGDVSGDGRPDLVVASYCADSFCETGAATVLLNQGNGKFQLSATYYSGGRSADAIALADINGDGIPDLLVNNDCADNSCGGGVVAVLLGNGDGTFQPEIGYSSASEYAPSFAVADVNGDGKPDVLVANTCGGNTCGSVVVMLGEEDGTLQAARNYNPGGEDSLSLAVADFNGDGIPDLASANNCDVDPCIMGNVGVLMGKGDGTFETAIPYGVTGRYPDWIAAADLNHDGKTDLVEANFCNDVNCNTVGNVNVLLGNGDGTFQTAVPYKSGGPETQFVAVADVNGDGVPDLVALNACADFTCANGSVSVFSGIGDGTFQTAQTYSSLGYIALSVAVGDVNGDGYPDLVVTNQCATSSNCANGVVQVLLNNGSGVFSPGAQYSGGGVDTESVAAVDLNGDGKLDLVVANYCTLSSCETGSVSVLLGNGDGTFQTAMTTIVPDSVAAYGQIVVSDFNGDGKLDVAIGSLGVLLPGNGDGTFQTPLFLGAGGKGTAVGDFNGDGRPDLAVGAFTVLLNISPVPASITSVNHATFTVGLAGSFTVTTSGNPAPQIRETGALPIGLAFVDNGNGTGTLSGTPRAPGGGDFSISFTANNGVGSPATQAFTIVLQQAPQITSANHATFTLGTANTFPVTTSGFPAPSLGESGTLPGGVTFADNHDGTGTLSGTPGTVGTFGVVLSASNAVTTASQSFTLTVAGISISPSSLNFGNDYLNSSQTMSVTLTNRTTSTVAISGVSIADGSAMAGEYKAVSHCGASLKAGKSCTITVTFLAEALYLQTATLEVSNSTDANPQTVGLSAYVIDPAAQFDPAKVAFGRQALNSSTTLPVELTNNGETSLNISGVAITGVNSGEFTQTNNCPAALGTGASCTISVTFAPTVKGARSGKLVVSDNVAAGQSTVALTGTGH